MNLADTQKQIEDYVPHILVPSLQKLGQSIPSCRHTVNYKKNCIFTSTS